MVWTLGIATAPVPEERRLALTPELVAKYEQLGASIVLAKGAGLRAHWPDAAFEGVTWVDSPQAVFARADVVACVMPPTLDEIAAMRPGSVLVGALRPWASAQQIDALCAQRVTAFALELLPRITRAQPMDILSSQATVAGYEAALIAADHAPKFFPMLTYAAGTIRPAKVFVIGCGVAGLQAIATARRLGAMVEAYDVRPETREQVASLGAKFVDTGVSADGAGGYARELTEEEKAQQAERLAKAVATADVLITTAAIPGKKAPLIITEAMIAGMKQGAVVVDMAAESGGNCALTQAGQTIQAHNATIVGPVNLPSRMPTHASELYAKNLYNFLSPFIKDGELNIDWQDEVIAGSLLCKDGATVHTGVKQVLGE